VTEQAEYMLEEWGIWAFEDRGVRMGYGSNILSGPSHKRSSLITDKEAELIDQAVTELVKYDRQCGDILASHYLGMPISMVCDHYGVARKTVYTKLSIGRAFVQGYVTCNYKR